jgi:hypothetical protein
MALFSGWSKYGFDQTCIFFTSKLLQDDSENDDDNIDKAWVFDWVPNFPTVTHVSKLKTFGTIYGFCWASKHIFRPFGLFVDILESQNFKIFGFIIIFHFLPSGKQPHNYGKIHHFNGNIHYKWPFSIAILNYQRVYKTIRIGFDETWVRSRRYSNLFG